MGIQKSGFLPVNLYFRDSVLPSLVTNSGEVGTRGYHVHFIDSTGELITGDGYEARCYGYNSQTQKTYYLAGVKNGDGWDLEVPYEAISDKGQAVVQIVLLEGEAVRIKSRASAIHVGLSLDDGSVTGHSVYVDYDIVKDLTEKAKETVAKADAATKEAEEATAGAEDAIKRTDEKISEVTSTNNEIKANEETRKANETERQNAESAREKAEGKRNSEESWRASAEATRQKNETDRINAENLRIAGEAARKSAEENRGHAENLRQEAEGTRTSAEAIRVSNENERITSENSRKEAETERVKTADRAEKATDYILSDEFAEKVQGEADFFHVGDEAPTDEVKRLWLDTDENGTEIIEVGPSTPESAATRLWVDTEAN